ncbi:MAG TPA: hypothetical protein DDZ80_21560 [Cyanobacteria bacterium UBA8803]|nr:hypothetical protein [Cyanobacteria bacterium UBA9273]HBL60922.1 hypothetical protein [Cyanobacteria bacterium UBA8803]
MNGSILPDEDRPNSVVHENSIKEESIQQAQEVIYEFLIEIVKKDNPERVLLEFKQLFILLENNSTPVLNQALAQIILSKNEDEFRNTLKRSCYILINNWSSKRKHKSIQELIQILADESVNQPTPAPTLNRLRTLLKNFLNSQDYQELKLFTLPYISEKRIHWSHHYTSYLLVPQYLDSRNPIEQREIAKTLSKRLKKKFKFELAMYTARCGSPKYKENKIPNPTNLGNKVIPLIKEISSQYLSSSYFNQASLFNQQIQNLNYINFKQSFKNYLTFSVNHQESLKILESIFYPKLDGLYENHGSKKLSVELLLRTCRRSIEFLTTEDGQQPSHLFILLTTQGSPLAIVIALLKIILICKYAQTHLEVCIAKLILYYEKSSAEECQWLINFLEIFNIVFTIYNEDIKYNLVKVNRQDDESENPYLVNLNAYRVFSQLKGVDLRGADLSGTDIRSIDLIAADLRDADLSGADLSQADLSLAKLSSANLNRSLLDRADLSGAMLNSANLSHANLNGADLRCAHLQQADLSSANLMAAKLRRADLHNANLSHSILSCASLDACNLKGANLHRANLNDANLSHANLSHANLSHTNLRGSQLTHCQLYEANITYSSLVCANLSHANLSSANLRHTDLSRVDLSHGNLSNTDLRDAILRHVNLRGADLSHANLKGANLFGTNLSRVNVKGAYFGNNAGLSEGMKLELEQKGAIVEVHSE